MPFRDKVLNAEQLLQWRQSLKKSGRVLVVTNGCFDLLHVGHATYLEAARNCGDALLVGITSDVGVRALKGPGRPLTSEADRAALLAALQSVDAVHVFAEQTATRFLSDVRPDIYVKGGDYTLETINQEERRLIESMGGQIRILPGVPGQSTSALLKRMGG